MDLYISDHYFVSELGRSYCELWLETSFDDYQAAVDTYNLNYGVYLLQEELADQACADYQQALQSSIE
jgi:hypothetical protein